MRFDYKTANPEATRAMLAFNKYSHETQLDKKLIELVKIRASQINRCAFCLDMHVADSLKLGESQRRLNVLAAWRESGMFSEKERAALHLTEVLTRVSEEEVTGEIFAEVRKHFDERELIDLVMVINVINCWNRITATTAVEPPKA